MWYTEGGTVGGMVGVKVIRDSMRGGYGYKG